LFLCPTPATTQTFQYSSPLAIDTRGACVSVTVVSDVLELVVAQLEARQEPQRNLGNIFAGPYMKWGAG